MAGIECARGKYVIMGDADDSYDFGSCQSLWRGCARLAIWCRAVACPRVAAVSSQVPCRFCTDGWAILCSPSLFAACLEPPVHDVYCGMRGFRKRAYRKLDQRCTGMEFATEMIIKASLHKLNIAEVPITLHPDGRKAHSPHLKTFRDGWRTLRLFFLCNPRWLFFLPGLLALGLGLLGYALAMPGLKIGGATLDVHTLLVASLALLVGHQCLFFALFSKVFSCREGLLPPDIRVDRFFRLFTLERGLLLSALTILGGLALLLWVTGIWALDRFGALEYTRTMRFVVPGVTLIALGVQTTLSSLMISVMSLAEKE